jgi:hypothetical protein
MWIALGLFAVVALIYGLMWVRAKDAPGDPSPSKWWRLWKLWR